ncbi:MAG: hypothetical protein ACI9DJ_001283 [Algoriphagus sp.]
MLFQYKICAAVKTIKFQVTLRRSLVKKKLDKFIADKAQIIVATQKKDSYAINGIQVKLTRRLHQSYKLFSTIIFQKVQTMNR